MSPMALALKRMGVGDNGVAGLPVVDGESDPVLLSVDWGAHPASKNTTPTVTAVTAFR